MSSSPGGKRKPSASPQASRNPSSNAVQTADGFTKIETKEERRKRKKVEKRRPQFQFDMSAFRSGKKVGMAVSCLSVSGMI
jgi:RNA exonuclease 1